MTLDIYYILSWLFTLLVGITTFACVKFFMRIRSLPPGPFPLPIIGNFLDFRGKDVLVQNVLRNYGKKYNNLFTFWMGPNPCIVVTSWDLCKEALVTKKNDFSGRVVRPFTEKFFKGATDVVGADFGPCWEALRKVFLSAVRKYSVSEKLADLVTDVVDCSVDNMLKEGKPFDGYDYAYLMVYNILANSAFGKRYQMNDPEFLELRKLSEDHFEQTMKVLPCFLIPWLEPFYKKEVKKSEEIMSAYLGILNSKYDEHKRTYQKGVVRDFIDALLFAKEEALEEQKDSQQFLVDENLRLVLSDFFSAGSDTTKVNLLWILLIICNQPEIQKKIQAEIDENIGSRSPRQEDKRVCPYTHAVMIESLRYRPVIDLTLEHKTICDTEIAGQKIPKDTACLFHILNVQREEDLWEDPDVFKPERFLDENGQLVQQRLEGYMAFGLGRRACPGEKLAQADVFLILARLLQKVDLQLENGPGSADLNPELKNMFSLPKKFNIVAVKRNFS